MECAVPRSVKNLDSCAMQTNSFIFARRIKPASRWLYTESVIAYDMATESVKVVYHSLLISRQEFYRHISRDLSGCVVVSLAGGGLGLQARRLERTGTAVVDSVMLVSVTGCYLLTDWLRMARHSFYLSLTGK